MRDYAIEQALAASKIRGTPRFVLAVIAYHWNDRDEVAFPGMRRIADLCGVSVSTVSRAVRKLVESGDLVVDRPGRGGMSARYALPAVVPPSADRLVPPRRNEVPGERNVPPWTERDVPESFRSRSALGGTELELELRDTRTRAREGTTSELDADLDRPRAAFADVGALGIAQARSALAPPLRSVEEDPR